MQTAVNVFIAAVRTWTERRADRKGTRPPLCYGWLRPELWPGLLDPGVRGRGFPLGQSGWRRDVANRDRDHPAGIQDQERKVLFVVREPGDRILVCLVVIGADLNVSGRRLPGEAFQFVNDRVIVRPPAGQPVGAFDSQTKHLQRRVRALRLEVRVFLPAIVVLAHEEVVDRPLVARREIPVVISVYTGNDALRMVLADGMGRVPEGDRAGELQFLEQPLAQRLLVEGDVVAPPDR